MDKRKLPMNEEHKRKIGLANKGKIMSTNQKIKISIAKKGIPSKKKGCKYSDELKKKMSEAQKNPARYWLGKHMSTEHRMKLSKAHLGEKGGNWRGGINREKYTFDWVETLRQSIRERDEFFCQECGINEDELDGFYKKLDVHHIDYNKNNCNPSNLISLCKSCHAKTNFNREYWQQCFNPITD